MGNLQHLYIPKNTLQTIVRTSLKLHIFVILAPTALFQEFSRDKDSKYI